MLAAKLHGLGITQGVRVAMIHENHPLYIEMIHALILLEAILVPLNTRLTVGEIRKLLTEARPAWLVYGPGFENVAQDLEQNLAGIAVIASDQLSTLPEKPVETPLRARLDADQAILFTSGTSGRPKGVRLSLANHLASAAASARRLGTGPEDRWWLGMPLCHVGGLAIALRSAVDGMTVVLEPRFDPQGALAAIREHSVTLVSLVPTMLSRLLQVTNEATIGGSVRAVLLGGGPIPDSLRKRALHAGIPIAPTYGLTEAASQVATLAPEDAARHPTGVGPPLPGIEVRIVDEHGSVAGPDASGEIQVRGGNIMRGYFNRPEATRAAITQGWLKTGDLGWLDGNGHLHLLDRRTDLIVSGGENVYPSEVEAVLLGHPGVAEVGVTGGADLEWGQVVQAFVVRSAADPISAEELMAWARTHLAGFKRPRRVHFVKQLPYTASGKLQREQLRLLGT